MTLQMPQTGSLKNAHSRHRASGLRASRKNQVKLTHLFQVAYQNACDEAVSNRLITPRSLRSREMKRDHWQQWRAKRVQNPSTAFANSGLLEQRI